MSWKTLSKAFALAIDTLDTIGQLAASATGNPILGAISKAVDTLRHGLEGKISLDAVEHSLAELRSKLHTNDGAADVDLHNRFPTG